MQKDKQDALNAKKRGLIKSDPTSNFKSISNLNSKNELIEGKTVQFGNTLLEKITEDNQNNFSRRLQKSKIKDLQKNISESWKTRDQDKDSFNRLQEELQKAKKDIFTDERKIEQRK